MSSCKVVILNWNGSKHLQTFLPSVVATTPAEVGIIVADNASTDDSLELLSREFPMVEIIRLDQNYGFAEGYNHALKQVEADYYLLLNSDVQTTPDWCSTLIEFMDNNPQAVAVAPKLRAYNQPDLFEYAGAAGGYIDALGYPFCRGRILSTIERDNGQYDTSREVFWASGAAIMFRAKEFNELGGFDGSFFAHMEEIDLCWRAQLAGHNVCVEPRSVVYHLGGGTLATNSPRKVFLNHRNNLWMLYKNMSGKTLIPVLIIRLMLDGATGAVYLLKGTPALTKAVWSAHMEFYKQLPALRAKRKAIQSKVVRRSTQIYRGSIIIRYILGRKKFDGMKIG